MGRLVVLLACAAGCNASYAGPGQQIASSGPTTAPHPPWAATTELTVARSQFGAAVYGEYVYVAGGYRGDLHSLDTVEYARLEPGGRLGTWKSATPFDRARCEHAVVAAQGHLYVLGGYECGGGALDDVQVAPIHRDGSLGSWKTTSSFKTARYGLAAVAAGGHIYILGGQDPGGGALDDVQVAEIHRDGSLGSWQPAGAFHGARFDHDAVVWDGRLYVIGGARTEVTDVPNGKSYSSRRFADVQVAAVRADGSLGAWQDTTPLPTAVNAAAAVASGGRLFVLGGNSGAAYLDSVQTARIARDGRVGEWRAAPPFADARVSLAAVAAGEYLYVLGGNTAAVEYLWDVQVAPTSRL